MKTNVIFVIDGSGSMGNKATDVRGGFNTYVEELRKQGKNDDYTLTATVFNTSAFTLFTQYKLSEVPKLDQHNYVPGGGTALYDAIGVALEGIRDSNATYCHRCGKKRGQEHKFCASCGSELVNGKEQFIVVIMTDGEENSSRRYRKLDIVGKIKRREDKGNWTFVYLGANQDAMHEGALLGIQTSNSYNYGTAYTGAVFANTATATTTRHFIASTTGTTNSANLYGDSGIMDVNVTTGTFSTPSLVIKDDNTTPPSASVKRPRRKR